MLASEIKVKGGWFIPHFPPREDRPLEMAMVREWKEYMSYEDHFADGWSARLAVDILAPIPGGQNVRTARTATTFALWVVTPVGRSFIDPVLRKVNAEKNPLDRNRIPISEWAVENQLGGLTENRLVQILKDSKGDPVYKNKPYPTLPDHRAAEMTLCFLVSSEGRELLRRVCQSTTGNWLPF